nr:hypothetical protein GCM10010200_041280 [Actinomadura rugatobispora]
MYVRVFSNLSRKQAAEASGMAWTHVRPGEFIGNYKKPPPSGEEGIRLTRSKDKNRRSAATADLRNPGRGPAGWC